MDIFIYLLVLLMLMMVFGLLGYVAYYRMRRAVENQHAGWYTNNDPRFWVSRYRSECPRGCQLVGRWSSGNADKRGGEFGCPNGQFCYGDQCCKYDQDCSKC